MAVGGYNGGVTPEPITAADGRREATFSLGGSQVLRESVTGDEVFTHRRSNVGADRAAPQQGKPGASLIAEDHVEGPAFQHDPFAVRHRKLIGTAHFHVLPRLGLEAEGTGHDVVAGDSR